MRGFLTFGLCFALGVAGQPFLFAQDLHPVSVEERTERVSGVTHPGLSVDLVLGVDPVRDLWKKELKKYGKVSAHGEILSMEGALMPDISNEAVNLTSMVTTVSGTSRVWVSLQTNGVYLAPSEPGYRNAKKWLEDFGLRAYTQDINTQIADAERAVEVKAKAEEKLVKEFEHLTAQLDKNMADSLSLVEQVEANRLDREQLRLQLDQNEVNRQAAHAEVLKMQQALELTKGKLGQLRRKEDE